MDPGPGATRRSNGLVATRYQPVGDVDPRVGEHLLDLLCLSGIPAYLQPSADVDAVLRVVSLPTRPADRLYVDAEQVEQAHEVVAGLDVADVVGTQAAFAELARGELPADRPADFAADRAADRAEDPVDEDERFVPPPPPPLPRLSRAAAGALAAIAGGALLLLWPQLLGLSGELAFAVAVAAIAIGVGTLVWRLRDGPGIDDRPDDGSAV